MKEVEAPPRPMETASEPRVIELGILQEVEEAWRGCFDELAQCLFSGKYCSVSLRVRFQIRLLFRTSLLACLIYESEMSCWDSKTYLQRHLITQTI